MMGGAVQRGTEDLSGCTRETQMLRDYGVQLRLNVGSCSRGPGQLHQAWILQSGGGEWKTRYDTGVVSGISARGRHRPQPTDRANPAGIEPTRERFGSAGILHRCHIAAIERNALTIRFRRECDRRELPRKIGPDDSMTGNGWPSAEQRPPGAVSVIFSGTQLPLVREEVLQHGRGQLGCGSSPGAVGPEQPHFSLPPKRTQVAASNGPAQVLRFQVGWWIQEYAIESGLHTEMAGDHVAQAEMVRRQLPEQLPQLVRHEDPGTASTQVALPDRRTSPAGL